MSRDTSDPDRPFPLKRRYLTRILPGLFLFVAVLVVLSGWAATAVVEQVYLEVAEGRAAAIASTARQEWPEAWDRFLRGELKLENPAFPPLAAAIRRAASNAGIVRLKMYDRQSRVLLSHIPEDVGRLEENPALAGVLRKGNPGLSAGTPARRQRLV